MLAKGKTRMVQLAVSPLMWYLAVRSEIRGAKLYQKTCVRINAPRNVASTSHRRSAAACFMWGGRLRLRRGSRPAFSLTAYADRAFLLASHPTGTFFITPLVP